MSLINEALKKAQRQRDGGASGGDALPPIDVPASTPAPAGAAGGRPNWVLIVVVIAVVSAGSAWLTTRMSGTREAPVSASPVSAGTPGRAAPTTPSSPPVVASVAASESRAVPAAPVTAPVVAAAPVAQPVSAPPTVAPVMLSAAAEKTRRQALVDQLRVAGVRVSERGNRALINDRLVRTGENLEAIPGLRVTEISHERIVLSDEAGNSFVKRLQ